MKGIAIRSFGEPEIMRLEDLPDPQPGPGQVVVRVAAAGVNPVDTYIRKGIYGDVSFPYTPGKDAAGTIEAVGEGVHHRKVGERVYVAAIASGTYAQRVLCQEFQTHPLPELITFQQGAGVGVPYGAAYRGLFQKAAARAGESVLVHGASGGVGLAAVQLARAAGLRVIATAGTDEGRRLVLEHGAHHVIDHHAPGHLRALSDLTCGVGVDVILEMLANVNLADDLGVVAQGGRVVVIGSRGRIEIDPRAIMSRECHVMGVALPTATEPEHREMNAAFVAGMENGTLTPVVSHELPLEEAARAHHMVMESSTLGKIVLIP